MSNVAVDPNEEFWRLPTVIARTGLSKSEIYRQAQEGRFPRAHHFEGGNRSFWRATQVREWQAEILRKNDH